MTGCVVIFLKGTEGDIEKFGAAVSREYKARKNSACKGPWTWVTGFELYKGKDTPGQAVQGELFMEVAQ